MRVCDVLQCLILALVVTPSACRAADQVPTIGFYSLDDQRLTGETAVISEETGFIDLTVFVAIDTAGKVVSAEAVDNHQKLDVTPALALVRGWTFRPQTFEGVPVNAVGSVKIAYRKRPIPANTAIPFPSGNAAEIAITLDRSACFGSCPDYRVTVHGDGRVEFDAGGDHFKGTVGEVHLDHEGSNVLLPGRHTAHIDPSAVGNLIGRFRDAHFFGLRSDYFYGATDNPTQVLTVRVGKASKRVTDYIGTMAGMPQSVRELEDAVDTVADTGRWVYGDLQTLEELDAAHFDYHARAGVSLATKLASKLSDYRPPAGVERLLIELIDRGVPLDASVGDQSLGSVLVRAAALNGSERLFEKLAAKGALASAPRAVLTDAFNHAGCSVGIVRALVSAGADPHVAGPDGTALTALRGSTSTCEDHPERELAMAMSLVDLGVPLEATDSLGWTALMGCNSPEMAKLLIAHGANPNAHDKDGTTPVLSTEDDRVARILLRAGADPHAKDENGSLRAQAVKGHMPATLAWLDAHGVP